MAAVLVMALAGLVGFLIFGGLAFLLKELVSVGEKPAALGWLIACGAASGAAGFVFDASWLYVAAVVFVAVAAFSFGLSTW